MCILKRDMKRIFGCDNQPRKVVAMGYVVADGVICRTGAISLYIGTSIYLGESGIHQQGGERESHDDHVALQPLLAKDDERGKVRGKKKKSCIGNASTIIVMATRRAKFTRPAWVMMTCCCCSKLVFYSHTR